MSTGAAINKKNIFASFNNQSLKDVQSSTREIERTVGDNKLVKRKSSRSRREARTAPAAAAAARARAERQRMTHDAARAAAARAGEAKTAAAAAAAAEAREAAARAAAAAAPATRSAVAVAASNLALIETRNFIASKRGTCSGSSGPDCPIATGRCQAKYDLWDDMQNPIISNLIAANKYSAKDMSLLTRGIASKIAGLGWMSILTSTTNNIGGSWPTPPADKKPIAQDPRNYSVVGDSSDGVRQGVINMLIVRRYTKEESRDIFKTIKWGSNSIGAPNLFNGKNFIFTPDGHIAIKPPLPDRKFGEPQIFYNPFINRKDTGGAAGSRGDLNWDDDLTMEGKSATHGVGPYTFEARNGQNVLFAMSSRIIMNKPLTYILYTAGNRDGTVTEDSTYYLLYNPVHTLQFKKFHQSLLQANGPTGTAGAPAYTAQNTNGAAEPWDVGKVTTYNRNKCGLGEIIPSYSTIIARYCNAFRVPGQDIRGSIGSHYADPTCPLAMSKDSSQIAFILGTNLTDETIRRLYWKPRGGSHFLGYQKFYSQKNKFREERYLTHTWACGSAATGTISSLLKESGLYGTTSPSFIQTIGLSIINSSSQWRHAKAKEVWNPKTPVIGRCTDGPGGNCGDLQPEVECQNLPKVFNTCTNSITLAGSVMNSKIEQTNECGVGGDDDNDVLEDQDTLTDQQKDDQKNEAANDAAEEGTEGCVPGTTDEATGKLSSCCISEITEESINCADSTRSANFVPGPNDEDDTDYTEYQAQYSKQLSNLTKDINKYGKVGKTIKLAHPSDMAIGGIIDDIEIILETSLTEIKLITSDIESMSQGTTHAHRVKIQTSLDTLTESADEMRVFSDKLITMLADNYLFGYKKIVVIAGAIGAAVLLLIILILLLK